ncbi:hypothetical protein QJS10_CPA06g01046 [Acorus calamus]|uniref:Uncharacterized protein n=1 Tax=Acorus calamus TaxID=4465 RepID=A0AAV9EP75_ACOCL|nr:hypothetical protein QJS10_CPA06g01046 [Acorus calamus]
MRSGTLEYWEDGTEIEEKQKGYYGYSQKLKHIVRLPFTTIGYDILKTILTYKGSMHPCKHAHVIKKIIEVILSSGAELEKDINEEVTVKDIEQIFVEKGIWIPYVDKNIKPVVGMCFDTLDEAVSFTSIILDLEDLVFKNHQYDIVLVQKKSVKEKDSKTHHQIKTKSG